MKRILLTSSSGGHYEQLSLLEKGLKGKYEIYVLTEKTKYVKDKTGIYYVRQLNRKQLLFPIKFFLNHLRIKKIMRKINPDIVISTGALVTISSCKIAKKMGKKVIFIESFAKIDSPTKTGKYLYDYCDEFIVQWETMIDVYPKAKYFDGGIY